MSMILYHSDLDGLNQGPWFCFKVLTVTAIQAVNEDSQESHP